MARRQKKGGGARGAREGGSGELPSPDDILKFVRDAPHKVGKREIARAFGIKGGARVALKALLAEMTEKGTLAGTRRQLRQKGGLPPVAVLEITGRDEEGDLVAKPVVWDGAEGERPQVLLLASGLRADASEIGLGDRVLARISRLEQPDVAGYRFEARPIKRLPREQRRMLGIFRAHARGGGSIEPVDRKLLRSWSLQAGDEGGAKDGDLVSFDLVRKGRLHVPQARVIDVLGNPEDQRQISLIAIHAHGIPDSFSERALREAAALTPAPHKGRTDLRELPLVTIDPPDARDHDDAVFAAPDTDPKNKGGFVVLVAIADVAHYVHPGSALDREALLRGNSVYFPDRVVPMLPERISNDLCSLREGEERPCLAVRMIFDHRGEKRGHTFLRGLMRSAARLSYQEAQAAIDGNPSPKCKPLMDRALRPLWAAYAALAAARERRQPLDLDLPERKIILDSRGRVDRVVVPERLAAHRLIEEFMIQANVAAAETLEGKRAPVLYRIHDQPSKEKLAGLREFLESFDMRLAVRDPMRPAVFNAILQRAKTLPVRDLVNEVVLRAQAQAEYSIENIGHFGLNLARYAHFTSPIRRYADLLVHRALIRTLRLGSGALEDAEIPRLADIARTISEAERRAMAAERETADRLIAAHLADRIGTTFAARVSGVTRSGLFVRLAETGADGFVPLSSLTGDFYHYVETAHMLVGARSGEAYRLGDDVEVRLVEAIPAAGALRFEMLSPGKKGSSHLVKGRRALSPRPARRRAPPSLRR